MTTVKPMEPHNEMSAMTSIACVGSSRNFCSGIPNARRKEFAAPNCGLKTKFARIPVAAADATNGTKIAVR